MAQNFLYMFEFVVDDLLITRPNCCAPEEYPTCCEITFRSSVYVSICDREFGHCVDMCAEKCGKCCLFSLESPVTDKDRLLIHIYKKKNNKCKFLVGATDLPIKPLFDKVTESFNIENTNWMEQLASHAANIPDPKSPESKTAIIDNDCDADCDGGRREQLCPTSELSKRLLPLFNMKGCQTGNLVLIMRLVCNGPSIVTSFEFAKRCAMSCDKKPCPPTCKAAQPVRSGPCKMDDPCKKKEPQPVICRRYFACNADKGCPCENCEDDCDRGECPAPCKKPKKCPSRAESGGAPCVSRSQPKQQSNCCCGQTQKKKSEPQSAICDRFFAGGGGGCNGKSNSCPSEDMAEECEAAKARALRKLRYLMQKYNCEN